MKIIRPLKFLPAFVLTLFTFVAFSQETFRDNFSSVSYSNNDGSVNWATDWSEQNDSDLGPTGDYIYINNNRLYLAYLWSENIRRTANLAGATSATLSFSYNSNSLGGQKQLGVFMSNNGGASFTQIATLNGSGTFSQNISAYISSNTTLAFAKSNQNWDSNDWAYVDNVQISANIPATISIDNVSVNESAGTAVFTVTHVGSSTGGSFTVNYASSDGTATAGSDYTAVSGTLTFNGSAGDTETISVPITDDTDFEGLGETFTISFTSTSNGSVNISSTGTGTISDNDTQWNTPLVLLRSFDGHMEYTATGGSLRTESNSGNVCAVTTSSSNTLTSSILSGSTIEAAFLYWSHSGSSPDTQVTFEGTTVNADWMYGTTLTGDRTFYGGVANVTSIIEGIGNPNTNIYDFSDLTIDTSFDYCNTATVLGGWSLIIFYSNPSFTASSINLYQGFDGLSRASTSFTLDSFFAIAGAGAKATFLSWEGDANLDSSSDPGFPEELSITNEAGTTYTLSGDGGQTGDNAYNSTIYDNTVAPVVDQTTHYGLDLDTYSISSYIDPADTQVTANVAAGQDFIISNAVVIKVPSNLITGTVFEDMNYGGGAGRNLTASSGVGVENATVELYNNVGTLIQTKVTDASGEYSFGGMPDGSYSIRVVNSTVRSNRGGGSGCTTCLPVQTFRTSFSSSTITEVTAEVGGADPTAEDPGTGTLTGAQSIAPITIASEGAVGIDFGYNFNTIVNTNDSGQGSLEQFIINSNALAETGMDQEANSIFDPLGGTDVSIFMIPSTSDPLGRTADPNYSGGVFNIDQNGNQLPDITDNDTRIDGRTQTAYSGDTNAGTLGAGGSNVGTTGTTLPAYDQPEIQVYTTNRDIFIVEATGTHIRNLSLYTLNSSTSIRLNSGDNNLFTENSFGLDALGVQSPAGEYGIEINGGTSQITGNYFTGGMVGTNVTAGTSTEITYNHYDQVGNEACEDAIALVGGTGIIVSYNLVDQTAAIGIEGWGFSGGATITENTITASGQDGGNCSGSVENAGIRLYGSNSTISNNIIASNGGAGVVITDGSTSGNLISQNSIYANGGLGIDLDGTSPGNPVGDDVTLNDSGDTDAGPNSLINFPIISSAYISGNELVIKGWTRPGTLIEFFFTDINEGTASLGDNSFGLAKDYGEGQTYIGSYTEGSVNDLDGGSSAYSDADGNTDTTNQYEFRVPLPSGTSLGEWITGTATLSNSTSEFSPMSEIRVRTVITNRRITYRVNGN